MRQLEESELLLSETNNRIEIMEVYLKVIEGEKENLSSVKENPFYPEYQNRLELLNNSYQSVGLDVNTQKSQYESAIESYENSLNYYNNQLQQLDLMKQSVNQGVNYFDSTQSYYYLSIETYIKNYNNLTAQYDSQIDNLIASGANQSEIDQLRQKKEEALENLKVETLSGIEQQISSIDTSVLTLNNNIRETKNRITSLDAGSFENSISNIQLTEINSINGGSIHISKSKERVRK